MVKKRKNSTIKNLTKGLSTQFTKISGLNTSDGVSIDRQQLYELYRQNPDIRTAVRKKSLYIGKNGFYLIENGERLKGNDKNKKEYLEVEYILSNPTFLNTKIEIIKHLDVVGEVYITPTWNNVDNKINGLQIIDPRTITTEIRDGQIIKFIQNSPDGNQKIFYPDRDGRDGMRRYFFEKHINNENMGMGLLEGIVWDAMADLEASKRNYLFFDNNMTPPSMFLLDKDLSEAETEILIEQLKEQYQGNKNSYKPLIGAGINDIKMLSVSPKDMEHIKQRKLTTDKVSSAFGVPKNILGYVEDVNLSNADVLMKEFKDGTINPYETMLGFILNDILSSFIPDFKYTLGFNSVSLEDELTQKDILMKEVKTGLLTINEYRGYFNQKASQEENTDKLIMQNVFGLVENMGMIEEVEEIIEEKPEEEKEEEPKKEEE